MRERGFRSFQAPGRGQNVSPQGDKPGSGPEGNYICPACGYTIQHTRLVPCNSRTCPKCGATLTRQ